MHINDILRSIWRAIKNKDVKRSFLEVISSNHVDFRGCPPFFTTHVNAILIGITTGIFSALYLLILRLFIAFFWNWLPSFFDNSTTFVFITPALLGLITGLILTPCDVIPSISHWINSILEVGKPFPIEKSLKQMICFTIGSLFGFASGVGVGPEATMLIIGAFLGRHHVRIMGKIFNHPTLQNQSIPPQTERVYNICGAGACVSGFLATPLIGAFFALEVPHHAGIDFFEAVSPTIISSLVSSFFTRMVSGALDNQHNFYHEKENVSYESYHLFLAILLGVIGGMVALLLSYVIRFFKWGFRSMGKHMDQTSSASSSHHNYSTTSTQSPTTINNNSQFQSQPTTSSNSTMIPSNQEDQDQEEEDIEGDFKLETDIDDDQIEEEEEESSIKQQQQPSPSSSSNLTSLFTPLVRAWLMALCGVMVGLIGVFYPLTLFWGEEQIQPILDDGTSKITYFSNTNFMKESVLGDQTTISAWGMIQLLIMKILTVAVPIAVGYPGGVIFPTLILGAITGSIIGFMGPDQAFVTLCLMAAVQSGLVMTPISATLFVVLSAFPSNGSAQNLQMVPEVFPHVLLASFVGSFISSPYPLFPAQRSRDDVIILTSSPSSSSSSSSSSSKRSGRGILTSHASFVDDQLHSPNSYSTSSSNNTTTNSPSSNNLETTSLLSGNNQGLPISTSSEMVGLNLEEWDRLSEEENESNPIMSLTYSSQSNQNNQII